MIERKARRPTPRISLPCPAIPTTSAAKISGTTSDLIIRRNTVPSGSIAIPTDGSHAPMATPTINAMTIACVKPLRMCLSAERRLPDAVQEVEREADHEPNTEPCPGHVRQAGHEIHAGGRSAERNGPDERHSERPRALGFFIPEREDAETDQDEREQRPDVGEVVRLAGIADQRPESHEDAGRDRRRPWRAESWMDVRCPLWEQSVTRHREEYARLPILEHEQDSGQREDGPERYEVGRARHPGRL